MQSIFNTLAGKRILLTGKFSGELKEYFAAAIAALGGELAEAIEQNVDYVVAQGEPAAAITSKVNSLRKKGNTIELMEIDAFAKVASPTAEQLTAVLKMGAAGAAALVQAAGDEDCHGVAEGGSQEKEAPRWFVMDSCKFDGLDLTDFDLTGVRFLKCSFAGCKLDRTIFSQTYDCDFSNAKGEDARFIWIDRSKFVRAELPRVKINSHLEGSDFFGAQFEGGLLRSSFQGSAVTGKRAKDGSAIFKNANLKAATIDLVSDAVTYFDGADLSGAQLAVRFNNSTFKNANFTGALLIACTLTKNDFSGANFTNANLASAYLAECNFTGATFEGCNLRHATIAQASFPPGFDAAGAVTAMETPKVLSDLTAPAKSGARINCRIHLVRPNGAVFKIDFTSYGHDAYTHFPEFSGLYLSVKQNTPANVIEHIGNVFANCKVDFGQTTIKVSETALPKKDVGDLLMRCLSAALGTPLPSKEELAAAKKAKNKSDKDQRAVEKVQQDMQNAAEEKAATIEEKKTAAAVARKAGKVTDLPTFLKALSVRIEKPKIDKATSMLKASGFKLFNEVTDTHVAGVLKSQTDPDLVYACRLEFNGSHACCTQNLNICGGLRGSICKHLLVLIIGLVQAGELDAGAIDTWVAATRGQKAELDKEIMGAIFLKYKGAEAGEVDWRPTETTPEDYYAL